MPRHAIGDQVVCQIREHQIVSMCDTEFDEKRVFEIIAFFEEGYLVYVPQNLYIIDTTKVIKDNYARLKLHKKFIGDEVCFISDHKILAVHASADGMFCANCGEFISMAGPNQSDGITFICYLCRENKFR